MAIPKDKLENWSRPGKNENSQATYAKMRELIENNLGRTEVFLQGSYANSTNVRDNSDIDIVVIFPGLTYGTFSNYDVRHAKDTLFNAINGKGNFQFTKGNKTVKYRGNVNYVPADIVPCVRCIDSSGNTGIIVYDHKLQKNIKSYPKQHIKNGETKSANTKGNYKKAVRMFKNARNYAVDKGLLSEDICPSYSLECLLYNVPDDKFSGNESEIFFNVLDWLYSQRNSLPRMVEQCRQFYLLSKDGGDWNEYYAKTYIETIVHVWDNW